MATKRTIYVDAGAQYGPINVDWKRAFTTAPDPADYTFKMQFRRGLEAPAVTLTSPDGGISVTQIPSGLRVTYFLSPEQTVLLEGGFFQYDLIARTGTQAYRLIEGTAMVSPGVTV